MDRICRVAVWVAVAAAVGAVWIIALSIPGCAAARELSAVKAEVETMRVEMVGVKQTITKKVAVGDISIDGGAAVMIALIVVGGGSLSTAAYLVMRKVQGGRFGPSLARGEYIREEPENVDA